MPHHANLTERERDEHADGVKWDQVRDAPLEGDDQRRRDRRQHDDPDVEGQAITSKLELLRNVPILARMLANLGKSAKAVLAASTSKRAVEIWIR